MDVPTSGSVVVAGRPIERASPATDDSSGATTSATSSRGHPTTSCRT
jgi:hypothetical protein